MRWYFMKDLNRCYWFIELFFFSCLFHAIPGKPIVATRPHGLDIHISTEAGLFTEGLPTGRVSLIFAPANASEPLDTDDEYTKNNFFGKNIYNFNGQDITLSGGSGKGTEAGVFGWPITNLDKIRPGNYKVQAFMNPYTSVTRSDGSTVTVHFPCGDGNPQVNGTGSLFTQVTEVNVQGGSQTIKLLFDHVKPTPPPTGHEIGSCSQGNYADTKYLKYVKIRSTVLSEFWGREMYVGANVLLPHGYDANDTNTRYPVVYSQDHWVASSGAFGYSPGSAKGFGVQWDNGVIPGGNDKPERPAPKLILIKFRHENPFYDDSYAVNTPNLGPYGDALNDELIPYLDNTFNTIAEPYGRIQEGGSTGGWESAASLIYRPDLFGACFSSYPDSLSFHRHQDIHLYEYKNAYVRPDGSSVPSIREVEGDHTVVTVSTAQENHWELTFGTSSRSALQWDIWFAVYGIQGLNGYPLAAWDKVTGEIYPGAVEHWKPMDLTYWVTSNWDNDLNLGEVLRDRINIYVGSFDNYYLNEGVEQFHMRTSALSGPNWANVTILPHEQHGGNYLLLDTWTYLELLETWVRDHAPNGKTPLLKKHTTPASRGNKWEDVIARGGHQAALARQSPPEIEDRPGSYGGGKIRPRATVGRWDPGVTLRAQWYLNDKKDGKAFDVKQGQSVAYSGRKLGRLQLAITGRKRDYADETRRSNVVKI